MTRKIVIAIDGFSSCGKSTMAKDLAKEIGYIYIDSGAMYRAITFYAIQHNLFNGDVLDEEGLQKAIGNIKIEFKLNQGKEKADTYLNGTNVEDDIRSMDVSNKVSIVSAVPFVRHELVRLQQKMGKAKGIVMDGRDIGTVVFPDAELKVFVTATMDVRAMRRLRELRSKGDFDTTVEEVIENIKKRDYRDQNRAESPLRKAEDAFLLDNTYLHIDEQRDWLLYKYNKVVDA